MKENISSIYLKYEWVENFVWHTKVNQIRHRKTNKRRGKRMKMKSFSKLITSTNVKAECRAWVAFHTLRRMDGKLEKRKNCVCIYISFEFEWKTVRVRSNGKKKGKKTRFVHVLTWNISFLLWLFQLYIGTIQSSKYKIHSKVYNVHDLLHCSLNRNR